MTNANTASAPGTPSQRAAAAVLLRQARARGVKFGDRKVFLGSIPAADPKTPAGRAHLFELHQLQLIQLARADFVQAMDPALVAASEMDLGGGVSFHFLVVG
jgi:hypothetical protein